MNSFRLMKYLLIILAIAAYVLVNRYEYVSVEDIKFRVDRLGIERACLVPAQPFYKLLKKNYSYGQSILGNDNLIACKDIGPSYLY